MTSNLEFRLVKWQLNFHKTTEFEKNLHWEIFERQNCAILRKKINKKFVENLFLLSFDLGRLLLSDNFQTDNFFSTVSMTSSTHPSLTHYQIFILFKFLFLYFFRKMKNQEKLKNFSLHLIWIFFFLSI